MHFYRGLFLYLFVCFRTVAGTFDKVALSQMFVLHSTEAWKEKIKVDEQDNCAQEKKNWFWKNSSFYTESRWCWSREAFSQSQLFPEIHHHILKKVKRGLVMIYPRILSDLHLGACQPHLISWSGKGWPGTSRPGQADPKTRIVRIFCIFLKGCRRQEVGRGCQQKAINSAWPDQLCIFLTESSCAELHWSVLCYYAELHCVSCVHSCITIFYA